MAAINTDIAVELVENLLEKPLSQVVAYICHSFSNETEAEGSLHTSSYSSAEKRSEESASVKKRPPLMLSGDDQPLSKKPKEVESKPSMSTTKEVTSWRRGQCFANGRYVQSIRQFQRSSWHTSALISFSTDVSLMWELVGVLTLM